MIDDALARIALVLAVLLIALIFSVAIRLRNRPRPRPVKDHDLEPGLYLFTSATCEDCAPARRTVRAALGEEGFTELDWESSPGAFTRLGVGAVPSTIVVGENGSAMLFPGPPNEALRSLSP